MVQYNYIKTFILKIKFDCVFISLSCSKVNYFNISFVSKKVLSPTNQLQV